MRADPADYPPDAWAIMQAHSIASGIAVDDLVRPKTKPRGHSELAAARQELWRALEAVKREDGSQRWTVRLIAFWTGSSHTAVLEALGRLPSKPKRRGRVNRAG